VSQNPSPETATTTREPAAREAKPVGAAKGPDQPTAPKKPVVRRGYDRQVRYGRVVGLIFCAIGFTSIGLGWNGMARVACPDCQLPYLLSGGATGIGLVLLGTGLMVMAQLRDERIKLAEQIRNMGSVISKAAVGPLAGPRAADGRFVAGKSTYHRPDCRLVEGKSDLDYVTAEMARASGLSPCRVCRPEPVDASAEGRPAP
jgi:hypothetical protein